VDRVAPPSVPANACEQTLYGCALGPCSSPKESCSVKSAPARMAYSDASSGGTRDLRLAPSRRIEVIEIPYSKTMQMAVRPAGRWTSEVAP
jgi:hypothetical protein